MIGAEGRKARAATGIAAPDVPDVDAAKEAVIAPDGPGLDKRGAKGLLPTYAFDLHFVDQRGRLWSGLFKAHVLTYREKIQVGLLRARLSNNVPPAALDGMTYDLLEIQAHLSVSIDSAPDWAQNLMDLYDPRVAEAIYAEVASYEARFHGAISGNIGQSDGPDAAGDVGADSPGENG